MISQKTLDALKGIGLNLYERKLYAALLARGNSTAGELSEVANVPRSRSYDVLESLAKKGFVVVQNAKPLRYVVIPPTEALDRSKNKIREDAATSISRIDDFKKSPALDELAGLHSTGVSLVDSADISGALRGRYSMHQQAETMMKGAENSISIITTEDGLTELYTTHSGLIQNAIDKGVSVKIAAPLTAKNKQAADVLSSACDVRNLSSTEVAKLPAGRMFVVDEKESIMALTDDTKTHPSQDVAFWTASDHFAKNFVAPTFDMIWKHIE
ncbi:MAG: hypothetical protein KAS12_06945 [Candidatus Aenigmarchaeota archaeon]|nr:hypothetical protein [Candidatus Aenigmarchaeota archaeon]